VQRQHRGDPDRVGLEEHEHRERREEEEMRAAALERAGERHVQASGEEEQLERGGVSPLHVLHERVEGELDRERHA